MIDLETDRRAAIGARATGTDRHLCLTAKGIDVRDSRCREQKDKHLGFALA